MAIDFTIQNQGINNQSFTAGFAGAAQQASGTLMGQQVSMVSDPMSLLADCAEELTFSVDTTDEFELQERKEKDSIELDQSELIKRYQEIAQKDEKYNQALSQLKENIKELQGRANAGQLQQLAKDLTDNPSQAFSLLKSAYDDLKKAGVDGSTLVMLDQAIKELAASEKSQIVAGIQVELSALDDPSFGNLENKNALYTTCVHAFTTPNEVYGFISTNYSADTETALSFLYKTIGNDINADVNSMEKSKLQSVNTSLGELRAFQSAHSLCNNFVERIKSVHDMNECPYTGLDMMGKILDFKDETYLSANKIENLVTNSKIDNPEKAVLFLQELLNTTRQFSTTLFNGTQDRMKVIDAVQQAVDNAVTKEDEWLASME